MSAKEILEAYASGTIGFGTAKQQLRATTWRPTQRTEAELSGAHDPQPPNDNDPDWIQIVPGLSDSARAAFTRIYDNR